MGEILDAFEAAKYLKVSRQTVMRLAYKGNFGNRVGKKWRFLKGDLERFVGTVVVSDHSKEGASHEQVQAGNSRAS